MSDCSHSPTIIERTLAEWRAALLAHRAGYTPEWYSTAERVDFGIALAAILARQLDIQTDGLNAMPLRQQLEFLDRIGASLLSAQSARAPLVFTLIDGASDNATVPAGTRVAAVLPPPAPSLDTSSNAPAATQPEYFTEQDIVAMRGTLAMVYSIDPSGDVYADHSADLQSGFVLFDEMIPEPHRLALGHAELFRLSGVAQIVLTIDFATSGIGSLASMSRQRPLLLDWEYLSVNGWLPLTLVDDGTQRFTRDGNIVLSKLSGPDAQQGTLAGVDAYWIRATVSSRIPAARCAQSGVTVVAPPDVGWAVEVEHTWELLPGDVATIDGVITANVIGTTDHSIILDVALDGVVIGDYLTLANALPPLRPDGADEEGVLPQVDTIRARVGFTRSDLPLDSAILDGFQLDISKEFLPFGAEPTRYACLYLSCKDAFSRTGARIELDLTFAEHGAGSAQLAVEIFDGTRWTALTPNDDLQDKTASFTTLDKSATISFVAPRSWTECEINGDKEFWLRLRIASGDYGKPRALSVAPDPADSTKFVVANVDSTLQPPTIALASVAYTILSNPTQLDYCLTDNDFAVADASENARWSRSLFAPFLPVSDRAPAVHFGFSQAPPAALVSLLVDVQSPAEDADPQAFVWDYWSRDGWSELSVRDTTLGFRQTGLIQFVGQPDAGARQGLGGSLYRIRARLKTGLASADYQVGIAGVWMNAVWASQGTRYVRDSLGISSGAPDQTFALPAARSTGAQAATTDTQTTARNAAEFVRALTLPSNGVPIIGGEVLEVREWTGRGDDWQTAIADVADDAVRFEVDAQDPTIKTAAWVRWAPQPNLYASGPDDRHYVVERARGVFRFPGVDGRVPPAGAPIVVSYVTGGSVDGNVAAGAIRELRSGVGFVQSVTNPLAAGGGAAPELLRAARDRSAQTVRNRDRAVSREDYEWLALEASAEVARARALPLEGPAGSGQRGFVGLVIVPHSTDPLPLPSAELQTLVLAALRARAPAGVGGGIRIVLPNYVQIGVRAEILPRRVEDAGLIEARVRIALQRFMHPLAGGSDGLGWDFGEALYLSDVAALIEGLDGVDAVRTLQLMVGSAAFGDFVPMQPEQMVAAGESQLKIQVPSVSYALA